MQVERYYSSATAASVRVVQSLHLKAQDTS